MTPQQQMIVQGKRKCYCHVCAQCCGPSSAQIIKQLAAAGKELNQLIRNTAGVEGWEIPPSIVKAMEVFK